MYIAAAVGLGLNGRTLARFGSVTVTLALLMIWKFFTPRNPSTKCNYWVPHFLAYTIRCGRIGLPPKRNYLFGSFTKIGYGPPTAWRRGGGQIAAYAHFASNAQSPWITFSFIVGSL
jgi:hypothetical protein